MDHMQVETPIEKDGDTFVMRGCLAHACTIKEAILAIEPAFYGVFVDSLNNIPESDESNNKLAGQRKVIS
jgi:hypothetical protein